MEYIKKEMNENSLKLQKYQKDMDTWKDEY